MLTWDGAGNAVPFQAIVEGLHARGHEVAVWSHVSNCAAFERFGARTTAYPTAQPYDAGERFGSDEQDHARWVFAHVIASPAIGADALTALTAEQPDAVVIDDTLLYAHAAVQASGVPAAALAHVPIANERARAGRNSLFAFAVNGINAHRRSLSLKPVSSVLEATESTGRLVAATAPTFDPPASESPALQVGAIRPSSQPGAIPDVPTARLVLVALSSGWMHQIDLMQRILDAFEPLDAVVWATLGPSLRADELRRTSNAELFESLPHEHVLPAASLLVTHAGHGTLMAGLAHGVPMLCIPLGRDQPVNAARAAELGAAIVLDPAAAPAEIRAAATALLANGEVAEHCRRLSARIRTETRLDLAITAIEHVAEGP